MCTSANSKFEYKCCESTGECVDIIIRFDLISLVGLEFVSKNYFYKCA